MPGDFIPHIPTNYSATVSDALPISVKPKIRKLGKKSVDVTTVTNLSYDAPYDAYNTTAYP